MPEIIKSRDNELIKYISSLVKSRSKRKEDNAFVAEGFRLCEEICKTLTPQKVFYTQKAMEKYSAVLQFLGEHYIIEEHVADKISGTKNSQGVFALFNTPKADIKLIKSNKNYLVLENVQDPANIGASIRSAAAFGFDGAILLGECADVFGDKALRASVGASARISMYFMQDTNEAMNLLKQNNIISYAATLKGSKPINEIEPNFKNGIALLIGNEGAGLSEIAVNCADFAVRIPMSGNAESLNASVAAGIMLYHFSPLKNI